MEAAFNSCLVEKGSLKKSGKKTSDKKTSEGIYFLAKLQPEAHILSKNESVTCIFQSGKILPSSQANCFCFLKFP